MNKVYQCFPGGKHKALTLSYDDGKEQDRRLVALFNQYGIKGTFHINSGLFADPKRVQPEEIAEAFWLPVEEAAARLTYERDRRIMRDAFAHILKYHAT